MISNVQKPPPQKATTKPQARLIGVSSRGSFPSRALPDWLVRRIVDDADADHSRHPAKKIPFIEGGASWPLTITTILVMGIGMWLPFSHWPQL
jgi:hypothetical protein